MTPPTDRPLHVDFVSLRIRDPDFDALYRRKNENIDFHDPETVQQITRSILIADFNLKIELPPDRLCPPVPIRYEYVRYIQDLLDSTASGTGYFYDKPDASRKVVGIDIGTGASAIYPLLATSVHQNWTFHATELDSKSYGYASNNITQNNLGSRITLHRVLTADAPLIPPNVRADFLMCNPPFYDSPTELNATHDKSAPPSAVCTGAEVEMICPGGDLGFATRLLNESPKAQVTWCTVMLGKLSSVGGLVDRLKEAGIKNWVVSTLKVGSATRRWVVGWSWGDRRAATSVARGIKSLNIKDVCPPPADMDVVGLSKDLKRLVSALKEIFTRFSDIRARFKGEIKTGVVFAQNNCWGRAARRAAARKEKKAGGEMDDSSDDEDFEESSALAVRIKVVDTSGRVELRWLKGQDSVLFESFCGMMKRELQRLASDTDTKA